MVDAVHEFENVSSEEADSSRQWVIRNILKVGDWKKKNGDKPYNFGNEERAAVRRGLARKILDDKEEVRAKQHGAMEVAWRKKLTSGSALGKIVEEANKATKSVLHTEDTGWGKLPDNPGVYFGIDYISRVASGLSKDSIRSPEEAQAIIDGRDKRQQELLGHR